MDRPGQTWFTFAAAPVRLLCVLCITFLGCRTPLELIEKPIHFSDSRVAATTEYIEQHYGFEADDIEIVPKVIVIHWTAINDFQKTFDVFNAEELGGSRPDLAPAGNVNVSIHFVVDMDGTIYRLMPETWMARHVIGLNYYSIGIENIGGEDGVDNLTDAQLEANVEIVNYLSRKYSTIEYLIGHYEYQQFEGHPLWLELDPGYRTVKTDPGERFMALIRSRTGSLGLKSAATGTD